MATAKETKPLAAGTLRFGSFELKLADRDLRNNGVRVKLQEQPFQVLKLLLEQPGDVVTRRQLAEHLWPGLHVNFERSLNTAVNALRQALSDSSRNPGFIETIPGLGYRFVAPVEPASANSRSTNSEAHQNYLKGRYFHNKMTEADLHKSIAYFQAALAEDPCYALAYSGLADTYCLFASMGVLPPREAYASAKEYAAEALRLDDNLAEAHASLASVKHLFEWDSAGSEPGYRRALKSNPNCTSGLLAYATQLSAMGRHEEALRHVRSAQQLDPLSLVVNTDMAWHSYLARNFRESMQQSWKTLAMEPGFAPAQNTLGLAYQAMGMHDEAILELQNARACSGRRPISSASLAHAYAQAGQHDHARVALRELKQREFSAGVRKSETVTLRDPV
ncbi:MAG: winged helix-turn-helix domain-containing protein, partial [Acidobacteriota bacterium]|nr:winged helix-turn-helix domain-containing protein [Acidobacteriota bacterium]